MICSGLRLRVAFETESLGIGAGLIYARVSDRVSRSIIAQEESTMQGFILGLILIAYITLGSAFGPARMSNSRVVRQEARALQMNFFEDAVRFFGNMNKEASAKHILLKGDASMAREKLVSLKAELENAEDLSSAFSDLAAKVSQCPSANRGGNLGTFKPGMMVKEFDKIVFEEDVGKVHGPVSTQFGEHLILVTRRYEGQGGGDDK